MAEDRQIDYLRPPGCRVAECRPHRRPRPHRRLRLAVRAGGRRRHGRSQRLGRHAPELACLKVRLRGVDTPEQDGRAKCPEERATGRAATMFTSRALAGARVVSVRNPTWGKWGGRVVADLILDGRSLSGMLIAAGYGRPYSGGERKSWRK